MAFVGVTTFALWLGSRWIGEPDQDDRDDPMLWAVWRETSLATGWAAFILVSAIVSLLLTVSLVQAFSDRQLAFRVVFSLPILCLVATAAHIFLFASCAFIQKRARPFAILDIPSGLVDLVLFALVAVVWIGTYSVGIGR